VTVHKASVGASAADGGSGRAWQLLAVTSVSVVLIFLLSSSVNVALPAMSRDLEPGPAQSSWFLLSYMFTTTAFILVFGRLGDVLGRRRLYLAGLAVFVVGTLASGLAPSAEWFIAFRLAQGIGAAAVITTNTPILTDAFPRRSLSVGLGVNATAAAVGQVIGPVVGGIIVDVAGWRWLFLGCVPLVVAGFAVAVALVPRSAVRSHGESIDVPGALLVTLGIGALVYASNDFSMGGRATSPGFWAVGAVAVALIASFIAVQRRRAEPLVDPQIFTPATVRLFLAGFFVAFANNALVLVMSLYLQNALSLSAGEAGVRLVAAPIATTIAALIAGRLVQRFHAARVAAVGALLIAFGAASAAGSVMLDGAAVPLVAGMLLSGLGTGIFMTPNTSELMVTVPRHRRGIGNAVRSTLQNGGYLFGAAVTLGLSAALLDPADRGSVHRGSLLRDGGDLEAFSRSVVIAIAVIVVVALAGVLMSASAARRVGGAGAPESA